jgi:hypothetical protein
MLVEHESVQDRNRRAKSVRGRCVLQPGLDCREIDIGVRLVRAKTFVCLSRRLCDKRGGIIEPLGSVKSRTSIGKERSIQPLQSRKNLTTLRIECLAEDGDERAEVWSIAISKAYTYGA